MTKQLRYLFMLLLSMMVSAHSFAAGNLITEQVTVDVATAGTLSSKIPEADKCRITNLKLTGELNVEDIKFVREMAGCYYNTHGGKYDGNLQHLDLGGAKFVGEGEFAVYVFDFSDTGTVKPAKFTSNAVGDYVFFGLRGLKSIVLPDGLQSIGNYAFGKCKSLSSVTLPNRLQSIGNRAFYYCESLSSVSLPDGLQSIGNQAFSRCESLSSVSLPDGLQSTGEEAFYYCESLSSVSLPDDLQTIGNGTFYYCCSLSSVSLPDGLQSIGDYVFSGCSSLASVYANMKVPVKIKETTFDKITMRYATLYVPQGCIKKYNSTYIDESLNQNYWRKFYNIKEIDTQTGIDSVTAHDAAKEVSRYGINGQLLNGPTKGVNIVKYSDGSVKKVVVE